MSDILIRRTLTRPQPFAYEEELPPQAAAPVLDQEEFILTGQRQAQPWHARLFLDEHPGAQLAYFFLEQEEPWQAAVQAMPWLARPFLDDDVVSGKFFLEDEPPWVGQVMGGPWVARPFLDDEIGAGAFLRYFFLEQEEFILQFPREVLPWLARPFLDEDPISIPLAPFGVDDEGVALSGVPIPDVMRALSWWLRRSPQQTGLEGTDDDAGPRLTRIKAPNLPYLARDPDPTASPRAKRNWEILVGVINSLMGSGQLVQVSPGVWKIVP